MIRAGFTCFALIGLMACAGGQGDAVSISTPAAQRMLAEPLPEYAAKLRIARQIAGSCDDLGVQ